MPPGGGPDVHLPRAGAAARPRARGGRPGRIRATAGARDRPGRGDRLFPTAAPKPIVDRVRADGPLLPPLTLRLARWIADHYLAPPALVLRSMLPPGLLERLELVAELAPGGPTVGAIRRTVDLLGQLERGPRPVRDLAGPDGRAGLLRRLRALETEGRISLEWMLLGAGAGPRYERWIRMTETGTAAAAILAAGGRPTGRALGPRQADALIELAAAPDEGRPAADLAGHHGTRLWPGSSAAVSPTADVRERPRRPLAATTGRAARRPTGEQRTAARPGRCRRAHPGRDRGPRSATAPARRGDGRRQDRDLRRGHRRVARGGPAGARTGPGDRPRAAARRSAPGRPRRAGRLAPFGPRRGRAGRRVAAHPGRRRGHRRRDAAGGRRAARRRRADRRRRGARRGLQERPDAAAPGARRRGRARRAGRRRGRPRVGDARGRERRPRPNGVYDRVVLPARPVGAAPTVEVVDLREELAAGQRGLLSRSLAAALAGLDTTAGEQAILVLNRRGTASVVLCRDCGYVQACPDCERPLVYHQAGTTLRCHHCGRATPLASRCPSCGSPRIRYLGGGTERVEREVRETFPALRVARLDRDVVEHRGAAERVIDAFADGRLDVLVGTSLVAKGLDIPSVTLVGVVSVGHRAQPARRARCRADLSAARPGHRPGRSRGATRPRDRPDLPARAPGDRGRSERRSDRLLRRRARPPRAVRVAAVRAAGQADRRSCRSGRCRARGRARWRTDCASAQRNGKPR